MFGIFYTVPGILPINPNHPLTSTSPTHHTAQQHNAVTTHNTTTYGLLCCTQDDTQ